MNLDWFVGFSDGEGSFLIHMGRHRHGINAGYRYATVRFVLGQSVRDREVVEAVRALLGFGAIEITKRGTMAVWRVLRNDDLRRLVEVFDERPLQSAKRFDYAIWRRAVEVKLQLRLGGHWVEFGNALKEERRRRGFTAAETARAVGVNEQTYYHWDRVGRIPPSHAPVVCEFLGLALPQGLPSGRPNDALWAELENLDAELRALRDERRMLSRAST